MRISPHSRVRLIHQINLARVLDGLESATLKNRPQDGRLSRLCHLPWLSVGDMGTRLRCMKDDLPNAFSFF